MKIASWNVNSIRQRLDHVKTWIAAEQPDLLFLQELKAEIFPDDEFPALTCISKGQKAYNGVAILSRKPVTRILDSLPGDGEDTQSRYLEVEQGGIHFINIYLPNGNPAGTEKYTYKLAWMDRLWLRLKTLREANTPFVIGGDFNIIPEDKDCFDPAVWQSDALFLPESRRKFWQLLNLGLTDAFRVFNQEAHHYTFWDYQAGSWPRDLGIRIDHFLISPTLADKLSACRIDRTPRGWDKASDHTPILIELAS